LKPQPGPGHFATAAGTGPDIDSLLLSARIAPAPQDGEGFDWSTTGSSGGDGVTEPARCGLTGVVGDYKG
jgi:hypothetical protein